MIGQVPSHLSWASKEIRKEGSETQDSTILNLCLVVWIFIFIFTKEIITNNWSIVVFFNVSLKNVLNYQKDKCTEAIVFCMYFVCILKGTILSNVGFNLKKGTTWKFKFRIYRTYPWFWINSYLLLKWHGLLFSFLNNNPKNMD